MLLKRWIMHVWASSALFLQGKRNRTHRVHIFEISDRRDIERHIAVRDYLRAHHAVAKEYGRLKSGLAEKYP